MTYQLNSADSRFAIRAVTNEILHNRQVTMGPPNPMSVAGFPYVTVTIDGVKAEGDPHFQLNVEGDQPSADEWVLATDKFCESVRNFLGDAKKVSVRIWPEFEIILADGIGPRILTGRTRLAVED